MPTRKQPQRLSSGDVNIYLNQLQNEKIDELSFGGNPPPPGKRKPPPPPPPPKKLWESERKNNKKKDNNDVNNVLESAMGFASSGRQPLLGANLKGICAVASSDAEADHLDRSNRRGDRGASATSASQSKSEDGSISINDVYFRDHQDGHGSSITHTSTSGSIPEGLTVMEKLKIAAKLDTSNDNRFLKELLETSIQDLEKEKERKKSSESSKPRSLPCPRHSRRHNVKESQSRPLSSSLHSERGMASSSHRHHSFRTLKDESTASSSSVNSATVAVPNEVHNVFSRIRGGKPLPREDIVSSVVRKLFARSKLDMGSEKTSFCVALCPGDGKSSEGIGKTTLAGLICSRGDVRSHYRRGIVWIDMKGKGFQNKPSPLDFDRYAAALSSILDQCGIPTHHLKLSPFVRTPSEDKTLSDIRMKAHMKESRAAAGKLLSSSRYFPIKRKTAFNEYRNILIVLDDLIHASDIEWFTFRNRGERQVINDVLVTSRMNHGESVSIPVPPLSEQEGVGLMLKEANLKSNHPISKNPALIRIVHRSSFHPLTIKYVGRWLSLKHVTGNKGFDEILSEINSSFEDIDSNGSPVDLLYNMLNKAIAPLVKGQESNTIRLCFGAFIAVFCRDARLTRIPLEIANELFLGVVDSKSDCLSRICPLFKRHGRHVTKLVPEVLGALGAIVITKHSTKEKTIQIDHELIRQFGSFVLQDESIQQIVDDFAIKCWNEVYARSYLDQYNWEDLQPDRSQKYALEKLPQHIIQAEMADVAEELLLDKTFIRGRFWTFGWIQGTKIHVDDVEQFWDKFHLRSQKECETKSLRVFELMESVLMDEVGKGTAGNSGICSIEEAGQCLHIISLSLGKIGLWRDAARFSGTCIELVSGSLETSEFIDTLLYNSALIHSESNNFEPAKENVERGLSWRMKTSGEGNVLYARGLCLLGDIMFKKSDYQDAELYFKKSIDIFKRNPDQCHLDLGIALFKLGKTQYERDLVDDALKCYDQASEFSESELPPNHELFVVIYNQMGDALLKKGSNFDATYAYKQALTLSREVQPKSHDLTIRISLIEGALHSLNDERDKAIEKYRHGLNLLRQFVPSNKGKIARLLFLLGVQFMETSDVYSAREMFQESIQLMKESIGPMHLDVAEVFVNLSSLEASVGKAEQAVMYLEETIKIQQPKLGDCAKVAVNLADLGAHRKATGAKAKAQVAYNDSIRILRGIAGQELELVNALLGLGDLMNTTEEYESALGSYNECHLIQKSLFGEIHEDVATTLYLIGTVNLNQCHYEKSLAFLSKSVDIMTKLHDEIHPFNGAAYNLMGFIEMKSGNENGALIRLSNALRVRRALGNRLKEAETLKNIGNVHRERNDLDVALKQYQECLAIVTDEEGSHSEAVVDLLIEMGSIMSDMNLHDDAISHYKSALQNLLRLHSAKHETVASILQKMGMIQFRAGNFDSALLYLEKAVETYVELGGDTKLKTIPVLFVIGNIHNVLKQAQEAQRAWNDAYEVFATTGADLYPEVKGSLTELLRV
eukprot:CCRYP_018422-RA/>CCRYP_018422-RA protein AED:0.01 eAED:0.01 QI:141/1/1/1/1/1/3/1098/1518